MSNKARRQDTVVDVTTSANCTINKFIDAAFHGKHFTGWYDVYLDFIDTSGIGITDEFALLAQIHNLRNRFIVLDQTISVIIECIRKIGMPPPTPVDRLKRMGYRLSGTNDQMIDFLYSIDKKEQRYKHDLRAAESKLEKLESEKISGVGDEKKKYHRFLRMLNNLGKTYGIDREKTTVDELALMIKEQEELAMQEVLKSQQKQFR